MRRVLLVHWKPEEAEPKLKLLKRAGFAATAVAPQGSAALKAVADGADVIVIDLDRQPMQGRAVGIEFRRCAGTRHIPLIFAGGTVEKIAQVRELLPDAGYAAWDRIGDQLAAALEIAPKQPLVPGTMAGYSGTPLPKKLGIKPVSVVALLGAVPDDFAARLGEVETRKKPDGADRAVLFITAMKDLKLRWTPTVDALAVGATLWIAWPKRASGMATDASDTEVRAFGLANGWVDYKICAIDETWSGLAFAKRKAQRATAAPTY